jgi:hypothetical protein
MSTTSLHRLCAKQKEAASRLRSLLRLAETQTEITDPKSWQAVTACRQLHIDVLAELDFPALQHDSERFLSTGAAPDVEGLRELTVSNRELLERICALDEEGLRRATALRDGLEGRLGSLHREERVRGAYSLTAQPRGGRCLDHLR